MDNVIEYKKNMKLKKGNIYKTTDGYYRLAQNKLYTAVVKIDDNLELEELKESLEETNLPNIPVKLFKSVLQFFQYIYKEHQSEVAILLWYNFKIKQWKIEVPNQKVSGGGVNYDRIKTEVEELEKEGFICVGSIHSHCEMTAFHSGTDDADEYNFDGLHITIGKVISNPEYACRFIIKENQYKLEPENCINLPEEKEIDVPESWKQKVSKHTYLESLKGYTTNNDNKWQDCIFCGSQTLKKKKICWSCGYDFTKDPNDFELIDERTEEEE